MKVVNPVEAEWTATDAVPAAHGPSFAIRDAEPEDAGGVAAVLAQAFPSLYRSTFGTRDLPTIVSLLQLLYEYGHLSLEDTRLCVVDGEVAGVMILHTGRPIGRGSAARLWRLLRERFGPWRAPRMFFGGVTANLMLNGRIPTAPDLVYIEALAVAVPHRGRGIGSYLLADAEAWARDRGRSRLALHVLASNTGARRLYDRTGFHPWHDQEPPPRWQSSWTAILMVRELS